MAELFDIKFDFDNAPVEKLLEGLQGDIAIKAFEAGAKEAGIVIARKLEDNVPRGDQGNMSSKRQSKSYKAKYDKKPLHRKIRYALRKLKNSVWAIIGAKHPDGNEIYPLITGHRFIRWGKEPPSNTPRVKEADDFLNKTFHQSKDEAAKRALDATGEVIQKAMGK